MRLRWQDYRPGNLSLHQRFAAIVALITAAHFAIGTGLWLMFTFCQTVSLVRTSQPGRFWFDLFNWLPFYWRSCKSITPLALAVLAMYFIPQR